MNKVLVTGATGFIGKHLVHLLLEQQIKVRVLLRNKDKSSYFANEVETWIGDLTDPNSLLGSCQGIDTVFHLGGYAHAETKHNDPQKHHDINFLGTTSIFKEAKAAHVKRFIFFSSVKAASSTDHEQSSMSPYGLAKRQAEEILLQENNKTNMHICILRPALVYGPGWKGNLASMLKAIDRGIFPPLPTVNNRRSMVSVNDICKAAILAANTPNANGKIYVVTDGIQYSTDTIDALMREALGKRAPFLRIPLFVFKCLASIGDFAERFARLRLPFNSETFSKLFDSAYYQSDCIERELLFQPEYNLKSMLPNIIKEYKGL